jgi:hypothetical protein
MFRRLLVGGLALGLMASALLAKPGVVTNKQGQQFKGDITEDDKTVSIDGPGGKLTVNKLNVASIVYDQTIDDQYDAKHAKLAPNDVKGRIALANWANDKQRVDLAIKALQEARQIDPTNREAALALDADQRQLELDQAAAKAKEGAATKPAVPTTPPPASAPVAPKKEPLVHRLLTADEINIIRLKELQKDDPKLKVKFDNGLIKRYLSSGDHDASQFNAMTPAAQAYEILGTGDAKMIKDIHILTDPAPLQTYKVKIQPIIAQGCAAAACHGGEKAGNFHLFTGNTDAATYTNFFILQAYTKEIDGVKYQALDRGVPDNSLVLQMGLPANIGKPAHPTAVNWKPRFRTVSDQPYQDIYNWLNKTLGAFQPDYGIKVAPSLPATQPAAP